MISIFTALNQQELQRQFRMHSRGGEKVKIWKVGNEKGGEEDSYDSHSRERKRRRWGGGWGTEEVEGLEVGMVSQRVGDLYSSILPKQISYEANQQSNRAAPTAKSVENARSIYQNKTNWGKQRTNRCNDCRSRKEMHEWKYSIVT